MKKKLFLLILLIALTAVFAVGCTVAIKRADVTVVALSVGGISKTEYTACDELDISGGMLYITYSDGKHDTVNLTEEMLDKSSFDMNAPGEHRVRVVYKEKSAYFTINISEWSLTDVTLNSEPYVVNYVVGEVIDPKGAMIKCSFEGNKTKLFDVTKDMLLPYDNQTVGKTTVNLLYYGYTMSFDVEFEEKTPIGISIVDSAENNYVFIGLGDRYDVSGMTVRISFDNDQSPKYDVKADIADDVYISMDDTSRRSVDAVLMYYPSDYREEYSYRFYGVPKLSVGTVVGPGDELASNKLERNGEEIALEPIKSKSYGTVEAIELNPDGSRTMIVSTAVEYKLTAVSVKTGDIIANGAHIGNRGDSEQVYAKGGGIVESVDNLTVRVKTAPTTVFRSDVRAKSYVSMEIISYPTPLNYPETTLNNMIEGDTLDKSKGSVLVTYDDGSKEIFKMDDAMIALVNDGKDSVNDAFELKAGRNRIHVVYGGILAKYEDAEGNITKITYVDFEATVDSKYPIELVLDNSTVINGQTFYFGDRISLSAMTYHVVFNNGTESESEALTEEMVDEGYSLDCFDRTGKPYETDVKFKLPAKYLKLLADLDDDRQNYKQAICHYFVKPQPISSIDFIIKPQKVYVVGKTDISFEGAKLDVVYRNNSRVTKDLSGENAIPVSIISVPDWDSITKYDFSEVKSERLLVFTRDTDSKGLSINDIVRKKTVGYQAKAIYYDRYLTSSNIVEGTNTDGDKVYELTSSELASFNYFILEQINGQSLTVKSIKVSTLKDSDGQEYYQDTYSQFEDLNFSGLSMTVTYSNDRSEVLEKIMPEMVYSGGTSKLGSSDIKFTYLGANDDSSLSITVVERRPTAIVPIKKGKTDYVKGYTSRMDFSEYVFRLSYNAGVDDLIFGSTLKNIENKEIASGWWYRIYKSTGDLTDSFTDVGNAVYELCYSYPYIDDEGRQTYKVISTMINDERTVTPSEILNGFSANPDNSDYAVYVLEVVENVSTVLSIKYEQNIVVDGVILNPTSGELLNAETTLDATFPKNSTNSLPVLAEIAAGWEIMLSEYANGSIADKVITVTYKDLTGLVYQDYVKIAPTMLDYDINDLSVGYRRVTVSYKNQKCSAYLYVWNAELSGVSVAVEPLKNYIYTAINSEDDLDLNGGIVRLTFSKYTRRGDYAGIMTKYINMDSEDLSYSGFVSGAYSKEGSVITITVIYKDYTADKFRASYEITVYDRQDVSFYYSNVIFFYGYAAPAMYTTKQYIPEFTLPSDIRLTYIETEKMITLAEYLALSTEERKSFVPVTVRDEEENNAPIFFVAISDIKTENYIDPVVGAYYVKYGDVYMIGEEFRSMFENEGFTLTAIPTYSEMSGAVRMVETLYVITDPYLREEKGDAYRYELGAEILEKIDNLSNDIRARLNRLVNVVVDKISADAYESLSEAEKSAYEEEKNSYYILMRVNDNRNAKTRFYETASYAFQPYTIIQKVISVNVETSNETAKVLRVDTKREVDGREVNGNPFAIFYLHSITLNIIDGLFNELSESEEYAEAFERYISSAYLASPNENYFEIVVKFTENYDKLGIGEEDLRKKEKADMAAAELMFRILRSLTSDGFSEKMEAVKLSRIIFDFDNASNKNYDFNPNKHDDSEDDGIVTKGMISKIREAWRTGLNVFDKNEVDACLDGEPTYEVSYTLTFGDTRTRNGVLQLLSGGLKIAKSQDGVYSVESNTLSHSSYTVDLSKGTVEVSGNTVTVK